MVPRCAHCVAAVGLTACVQRQTAEVRCTAEQAEGSLRTGGALAHLRSQVGTNGCERLAFWRGYDQVVAVVLGARGTHIRVSQRIEGKLGAESSEAAASPKRKAVPEAASAKAKAKASPKAPAKKSSSSEDSSSEDEAVPKAKAHPVNVQTIPTQSDGTTAINDTVAGAVPQYVTATNGRTQTVTVTRTSAQSAR